jgi:hypothetical protein
MMMETFKMGRAQRQGLSNFIFHVVESPIYTSFTFPTFEIDACVPKSSIGTLTCMWHFLQH